MQRTLLKTYSLCLTTRCNGIHTSNYFLKGLRQSGNAMKKVMGATRKRKLNFTDTPHVLTPFLISKGSIEGKPSGNSRRATVLNKLFMRHITDQMATGKYSSEILGHGIEVNRVQVTPDYKILRVYWMAKKAKNDCDIEEILQKNAGFLRHELTQLRVMGNVPVIQFIKDKHYSKVAELDSRLSNADFGPDHMPLDTAEKLKTEFEVLLPLEDDLKQMLKQLDTEEYDQMEDLPLPVMPQNVLGLQHAEILDRIKKSMKKSEAHHRHNVNNDNQNWASFKITQSVNEDPVQLGSYKSQRAVFKEFLQKRLLLRLKAKSAEKNKEPGLEYLAEELREREADYLEKFDLAEKVQEDYIIEDVDEKKVY